MAFQSAYTAKKPDAQGFVSYTPEEDQVWRILYERQYAQLAGLACPEFIAGIDILQLTGERVPQLPQVSECLSAATGWKVVPVAALIDEEKFFKLLAAREFPAATFIRTLAELDYVKEPDIFHELFGHCPMLTNPIYADFVNEYAKMVLTFPKKDWPLLQRLFWFTVEFGLLRASPSSPDVESSRTSRVVRAFDNLRAYGGGILSSIAEIRYSVESLIPQRQIFNPVSALRTPYRIDRLQTVYFVIDDYHELYDLLENDLKSFIAEAHRLGEFPPTFPVDDLPTVHIHAC